jgi:hypothetical protein
MFYPREGMMSLSIFARGFNLSLIISLITLLYLYYPILLFNPPKKFTDNLSKLGEENYRFYHIGNIAVAPLEIKGKFKKLTLNNLPKGRYPSNGVIITGRLMPPGNKIYIKKLENK